MYSTVKEIHVEIMNHISQVTTNRHRSIAPEYIDMMLNRGAIEYINLNLVSKINYKGEGFDDSQKRVDDLRSLKVETEFNFVRANEYSDRGYIVLPSDYLHLTRSDSRIVFSKYNLDSKKITRNVRQVGTKINFSNIDLSELNNATTLSIQAVYDGSGNVNTYDISDLLPFLQSEDDAEVDMFEFIGLLTDRLRDLNLNVYWEYFLNEYSSQTLFVFKNSQDVNIQVITDVQSGIVTTETVNTWNVFETDGDRIVQNDLIGTDEITNTRYNFYTARNRHLSPITEIIKNKLYVYFGKEFIVTSVKLSYIKKPKLFNIHLNQMSDLIVTPEFIQLVTSKILLDLKDNLFNTVKQQSNLI